MTHVLSAREQKLLRHLQIDSSVFQIRSQLPLGTGTVTLTRLTELGLLETGPGRHSEVGWRLSENGWRCMYGKPKSELGAEGAPHYPLKVWSWPPTPDTMRCSSFVNFCVEKSGRAGTGSSLARSWLGWGKDAGDWVPGCIVVLTRGQPPKGHVGFFAGRDGDRVLLLGGNQGDAVNISSFEVSRVIGRRIARP